MQTLEAMVVPPSTSYTVNQMPEGQQAVVGWTQAYVQPSMEQASTNSHPYLMNVLKPDQTRVRVMEQPQAAQLQAQPVLPPTNPASVITATYNPTYNRCLPKILSDLDCEMKIKQVLKCIENILLDGSDMDPQQSYKLPDRSSSPQLAPKKKIKVKEDEEMPTAPTNGTAAGAAKVTTNKSPVRINVKVEPFDSEKAQRGPAGMNTLYPDQGAQHVPSTSPRSLSYDFAGGNRMQQATPNNFPKAQQPPQRAFSFEPYAYSASNPQSNAAQFMQQAFLQQHPQVAQHPSLLVQQQLQAVQQHIAQQQQLLNGVNQAGAMHVLPLLQQNPQLQYHMQQLMNAHNAQAADGTNQPQGPENTFVGQMDEFPFPVFSNTILEEVNQFKPTAGRTEDNKKPNEAEEVFFFGHGNNLLYQAQAQAQAQAQSDAPAPAEASQLTVSGRLLNPLGSSSLLSHSNLPLLFQMPQLTGLEEDDKWILSLLNIDGHENMVAAATAPPATNGF